MGEVAPGGRPARSCAGRGAGAARRRRPRQRRAGWSRPAPRASAGSAIVAVGMRPMIGRRSVRPRQVWRSRSRDRRRTVSPASSRDQPVDERDLGRLQAAARVVRPEPGDAVDLRERPPLPAPRRPLDLERVRDRRGRVEVALDRPRRGRPCRPSGRSSRAPPAATRPARRPAARIRPPRRTRAGRPPAGRPRRRRARPSGSTSSPRPGSRRTVRRGGRAAPRPRRRRRRATGGRGGSRRSVGRP